MGLLNDVIMKKLLEIKTNTTPCVAEGAFMQICVDAQVTVDNLVPVGAKQDALEVAVEVVVVHAVKLLIISQF